jgi:chorismate mutase/prephenate dehydratase
MSSPDLDSIRKSIDSIDRQIVSLLNERYSHVLEVGRWKRSRKAAVYVPEREKAVYENLEKMNQGPMRPETLRAVYREIMSGALALEHPLKVAFFGPEATYTHIAAMAKFGHSVEYVAKKTISDVFKDVEAGRADYGCVPIENSTEGAVNHTLDMLLDSPALICAEVNLRVHHCLLSNESKEKIKKVYSHPQSLAQCRAWLQENLPGVETAEATSNTKAAQIAAAEEGSAAIASSLAGELYKLDLVSENIEDNPNNTTRFLVISNQETKPTGDDKTSICFAIKDRVGVLYDCLQPFKSEKVTLTMIESRPTKRRNWEYYFFIDLLGHHTDKHIQKALEQLGDHVQSLRILGSYPRARQA